MRGSRAWETGRVSPEPDQRRIRVLIVDGHDLFRVGLAALLRGERELEVVGQASGGRDGVRLTSELRPDVVLIDLRLADLMSADVTRAILGRDPAVRVLMLAVVAGEADVIGALAAGACGFLAKDTPIEGIVAAVRAASQGAAWLSPRAAEVVLARLRQSTPSAARSDLEPTPPLSPRERQVLRLIARGMENAEIAAALRISPRTAKDHVSNILAKLGLPSRVQAAVHAVQLGLA